MSLHEIQGVIANPEVKSAIDKFNFPAYVCLGLALLGCLTLLSAEHDD